MSIKISRELITNTLTRPALRKVNGGNYKLREVRAIIAHWTANTSKGADAMANRNYFNNGSPGPGGTFRSASAHYCVDSTEIVQCLPDDEVGFHVGGVRYKRDGYKVIEGYRGLTPNYFTIGFEMCVNSDGDWNYTRTNSIQLAAYLLIKHGLTLDNLLRHYDITGKDCPKMFIDESEWRIFKNAVETQLLKYAQRDWVRKTNTANNLNVRFGPGIQYGVNYFLQKNEPVVVFNQTASGWAQIGEGLYVNSKYLI